MFFSQPALTSTGLIGCQHSRCNRARPMTLTMDELLSAILPILPHATLGEDNDGQLVIYTDMVLDGDTVKPYDLALAERRLREEQESGCASPLDITFWQSEVLRLGGSLA